MAADPPPLRPRSPSLAKFLAFFIILVTASALWTMQKETQAYVNQLSHGADEWVDLVTNALLTTTTTSVNTDDTNSSSSTIEPSVASVRTNDSDPVQVTGNPLPATEDRNNNTTSQVHYEEFVKHDGVVIVTKLQGMPHIRLLEQSICLIHFAYNYRLKYDIVIFTTEPLEDANVNRMRELMGGDVHLTVVQDNRGFQEEVAALSPMRRHKFLERCKVNSSETLNWWSNCPDRLAYNWQAEFRSLHIWRHPALAPYKYMMWMDTDGFPTRVWQQDPVARFLQRDLYILFANFPQGHARHKDANNRIFDGTGQQLCSLGKDDKGVFQSRLSSEKGSCPKFRLPMIHGFFHITDLDFYRSDKVHKALETWIGDCFCCRQFDDQAAVTFPPAVFAPDKMMLMRDAGVYLDVYHNSVIFGEKNVKSGGFLRWWKKFGPSNFSEAHEGQCPITAGG